MDIHGVVMALSDADKHILEKLKRKLSFASSIIDCRCHLCGGLLLNFSKGVCGHWFCQKCMADLMQGKVKVCPIDSKKLTFKAEVHVYRKCDYFTLPDRSDWISLLRLEQAKWNRLTIWKHKAENVPNKLQPESVDEETDIALKMDNFAQKMRYVAENGSLEVPGESISLTNTNLIMTTKICLYRDRLEFHLGFDQNYLPLVYYHKRTVALLDQSKSTDERHVVRVEEPSFGSECAEQWMRTTTELDPSLFQPISMHFFEDDSVYVKDDVIIFRITIEPLALFYNQFQSVNGTLQWEIHDYQKQKQNQLDGLCQSITSDYFYSDPSGYRMQATLYFDTSSVIKRNYMSIHLDFLNGKHDRSLSELFPHRTTFKILNQDKCAYSVNDIQRAIVDTEGHLFGDRIDEFAFLSQTENPPYLVNDILSIKIIVEPL